MPASHPGRTVLPHRSKLFKSHSSNEWLTSIRELEDHYGDLAHHYSRSGNTPKAVDSLHRAGQQAVQRSANTEAVTHFTAALELLKTLPDTLERTQQELTLQIALGMSLAITKGPADPEVGGVHTRALALSQQVGDTPQLFRVLVGARLFYL